MKKQKKRSIIAILGLSLTLFACSSGSNSSNAPATQTTQEATGPVNYMEFVSELLKPTKQSKISGKSLNGAVWTEAGNIASLNPYAALAFSSASLLGGLLGFGQPAVSTNQIYTEELTISSQITDLQTQLTTDQNIVYAWYANQAATQESTAAYTFSQQISNISVMYNAFTQGTLGAASGSAYTLNQVPESYVSTFYQGSYYSRSQLTDLLDSLSSSQCASPPYTNWESAVSNYALTGTVKTGGPMAVPSGLKGGSLYILLHDLEQQLLTNLATPGILRTNMIPLISQYNQTVELIYLKTILALQQAYIIEASQNYFQYVYPSIIGANGLSYNDCPNANYLASEASTLSYPYAQSYLTQLFADRMNIAYQTALSFMISDHPMITLNSTQMPYESELSTTTQAKTLATNIGNIVSGGWQNQGLLYQESTILGYKSCAKALRNGESFTAENCPSLTPNMYSGYYNGESISGYIVNPEKNGYNLFSFDFSSQCTAESGITTWSSGLYNYGFMCNQWAIVNDLLVNYNSTYNTLNFQYNNSSAIPTPGWIPIGGGQFQVASYNKNYHIYVNSGSITNKFLLVNGNGNYFQQGASLYDGGFDVAGGSRHTAGMQVVLPNGFNLPFYIAGFGNVMDGEFLWLVCPSATPQPNQSISYAQIMLPYVTSCSYSGNFENSVITVNTLDGNSYNLELNGGGVEDPGHQVAYLAVYQN